MEQGRGSVVGQVLLTGKTVHVADVLADPEYTYLELQRRAGFRSALGVPLLREGIPIGIVVLMRRSVRPFTEKQIELATTFADQAVIAIENARLFDEVQARTSDLAQSVEELRALGEVTQAVNSTVDLETVLTTIVAKATATLQHRSRCDLCVRRCPPGIPAAGDLWPRQYCRSRTQGSPYPHWRGRNK